MVHSWLGLKLFLVLTLVMLTGTLAVLRDEIDWLVYPQLRVVPGAERAGIDAIVAAAQAHDPAAGLLGEVPVVGAGPRTALGIVTVSPDSGVRRVWVDPYRGVVTGTTPLLTPGYFLAQLHAYLLIPVWGYAVVCSFAVVLLIALVTGLVTYKRFWRGFFRVPRARSRRTLTGDLHRLGGVWSLWFLAIMVLTGLWYFWTFVGEPFLGFPHATPHHDPPRLSEADLDRLGPAPPARHSLDAMAATVRREIPGFAIRHVTLPGAAEAPVTFLGNRGELFADLLSKVHVDPYSGAIVGRELAPQAPLLSWLDVLADRFHYGDFGGLVTKLVWVLFGLITTAMAVTGLIVHADRTRRATAAHRPAMLRRLRWLRPWGGGMGLFKPVNLAVLGLSAWGASVAIGYYGGGAGLATTRFAPQAVGPWRLGATAVASIGDTAPPVRPGGRAILFVDVCPGCWPAIRRLWASVGDAPTEAERTRVGGRPGYATTFLRLPARLDPGTRLWIVAEGWDGARHAASWPLAADGPAGAP
nr:PepSY-associated TM helix domain-containing protein [Rhodoplanes tepidamans]